MKVAIELRRLKNLELGIFIVVGVAVYLTGKFVENLRDQNGTLSKLVGAHIVSTEIVEFNVPQVATGGNDLHAKHACRKSQQNKKYYCAAKQNIY